jgi:disulfide oxidoreductase YuzD
LSYIERRRGYGGTIRRARKVQARRSDHAKAIDRCLKAPKAKDVDQWLSAPNRFDLPNVDTNKPKKENG